MFITLQCLSLRPEEAMLAGLAVNLASRGDSMLIGPNT